MSIQIIEAGTDHLELVTDLFNQYRVWYHQSPDIPRARKFLEERLVNKESRIFIAMHSGEAAGFVQLYPIFTSIGMRRAWLLNDLFVLEKHRGFGIAKQLLERAKELGRSNDSKWLLLQTDNTNIKAQQIYKNNGWNIVHDQFFQFDL
jgi:GNAT superfamily N-acetyltransferase